MAKLLECSTATCGGLRVSTFSAGRTELRSDLKPSISFGSCGDLSRSVASRRLGTGTGSQVVVALGFSPRFSVDRNPTATRATSWGPLAPLVELLGRGKGAGSEEERAGLKEELLEAIKPVQRGVSASESEKEEIEELASRLEALNPTPSPLKSPFINGKWKLVYTTSVSILGSNNPIPFLRPWGPIFQCIDTDSLQARNLQTWPFFNQVEADLTPVSKSRVDVRFTVFKILSLIPVKAPQRDGPSAYLDTTYLDEDLRISRGNLGNLFVLIMDDASYRIEKPESESV